MSNFRRVIIVLTLTACGAPHRLPAVPSSPTPPNATPASLTCGVERWPVKTLSDVDAVRIDMTVIPTGIAALNQLAPHCAGGPNDRRAFPEEFQVFEVVGRVTLVRLEADHDFHIALADAGDSSQQVVAEVIDPDCSGATASPFRQLLTDTRLTFQRLAASFPAGLEGHLLRVRGVGFFDFDHHQTGRAKSCIELHPVLGIELVE